jgi:hypothetical protein
MSGWPRWLWVTRKGEVVRVTDRELRQAGITPNTGPESLNWWLLDDFLCLLHDE